LGWIAWWIFFAIALQIDPGLLSGPADWSPSLVEWIWMLALTIFGVILAVFFAVKLAARILTPINSVMDSVRRVAHGDLAARAVAGDRTLGETAMLVDDFNSMAERLERGSRESRTWNAAIAHELRTPVTILRGTLQGVVDGVFKPEEVEFRALLSQVEGLGRLIEDLRTLSLADSGQLQLRLDSTDLSQEIAGLARMLAPELAAAGFRLRLELSGHPVRCDAARMLQVVLALLDNARRYAHAGQLLLSTRVHDGQYCLQLEDAGPGIPDELAQHVFEAFRRGDAARAELPAGSGLGLAVVEAIAHAHGGRATCGRGTAGGALLTVRWPVEHGAPPSAA
jgi:two-component system sensor histidine kinase AdeS